MLPCAAVALSSYLPLLLISSEQVHYSSSSKSLTDDPKVVLDFFISGEIIGSGLNLSLGVGGCVCIFSQWDQHVGKGDVIIEHAGLLFFKNYSLVIGSGETCCCAT